VKVLSLTQPWATLVAIGAKHIDTRSSSTSYRGPIAIHAGRDSCEARVALYADPVLKVLNEARIHLGRDARELPTGVIVAVAELVSVEPTELLTNRARGIEALSPYEFEFGNYAPRRFGWLLTDVRRLQKPIPCQGALGVWTAPPDIGRRISAELQGARIAGC
jgi:activating signal cointegrator 1